MSFSEFSNTELIAHLREKIETHDWTPAEFIEAERRDENCLDADPELVFLTNSGATLRKFRESTA